MTAYLIGDVEVLDAEAYQEYADRFDDILAQFDGSILVVGGSPEPIEGNWQPRRLVVLSFPNVEQAKAWHRSAEYAEIAPIRQKHAQTHFITLVEGWQPSNAAPTED